MKKELKEMALQELWQLFPIEVVTYRKDWMIFFQTEKAILLEILKPLQIKRIEHIGSTAIPGIYAKDIVDILIEVNPKDFSNAISVLEKNRYILMNHNNERATFNKGYTKNGFAEKVYHLHVRINNDNDELYFRDYLIENHLLAREYEALKIALAKKYKYNRDAYTTAKSEFIKKVTIIAKEKYLDKYK